MPSRCVVIGASAGGFEPLKIVVSKLRTDLAAPVLVVLHQRADGVSFLPQILAKAGDLPAIDARDGIALKDGAIYAAAPDHHLLIDQGRLAVKRGPKENGFRPSIDALFRSAALCFGSNAIGVVLSGALNDGTSGLWSIKRLGGIAIVQDPEEAAFDSMPRSVLDHVETDYKLPAADIGPLIGRLVNETPERTAVVELDLEHQLKRMGVEMQMAAGTNLPQRVALDLGELTPFTCPECHGTLTKIVEGPQDRFRCHTGHGFTEDALLEHVTKTVGDTLWQATRGLQETEMLLEHMAKHVQAAGDEATANRFLAKAREIGRQASRLQLDSIRHEHLTRENLG